MRKWGAEKLNNLLHVVCPVEAKPGYKSRSLTPSSVISFPKDLGACGHQTTSCAELPPCQSLLGISGSKVAGRMVSLGQSPFSGFCLGTQNLSLRENVCVCVCDRESEIGVIACTGTVFEF